jgi:hypothetical protein
MGLRVPGRQQEAHQDAVTMAVEPLFVAKRERSSIRGLWEAPPRMAALPADVTPIS